MTLHDALVQAVQGNPTLASANIDVAIAEAQIVQARGVDDYVVNANANVNITRSKQIPDLEGFQTLANDRVDLAGGINRNLSDGGRVGLGLTATYTRTLSHVLFSDPTSGMNLEFDSEAEVFAPGLQLTFFQPLLRGFGEKVARAPRRRAQAGRDIATLTRAQTASVVVRDVVQAYWELAYAQKDLEIQRASLALAREQARITQARLDVGVGAKTDLAAVQQTIAVREEAVLLAEQAVAERGLALRQLVGMQITAKDMSLEAADRLELAGSEILLEEALARAMQSNPDLAVLRARGKAAEIEVDVAENGMLPQLDFNASAGPSGTSATASAALTQIGSLSSYTVQAGLVFSLPIENRGARGARDVARGNVRKLKVNQADLEAQIGVAVARSVNLVSSARKRLEVLVNATQLAQVNLDAEQARFDVGKSTNFDVLQRQEELAESELHQARAQADYLSALAQLQTLTGDILPTYGVELRKK